ncbi:MAG TPA: glycosyltransferase family 4 protein [Flavisolibacter sp.]|jgi:glycosyltransferase involved in cell wall biosynthesis|nr:glycosyltransferase family 4 protein [Flavisolibacter sp.]
MGVVLVFEPATDVHWMKDVVQFPNALSQMSKGTNATLITRPNHKQKELEKYIQIVYLDEIIHANYSNFEYSDFCTSKLITSCEWYLSACKKAADIGDTLILYPWFGDAFRGARIFKIKRWLKLKKAFVVFKTDGFLRGKSNLKLGVKGRIKDYFKYFFFDKIICENREIYTRIKTNQTHLGGKLTYIPNCPLDIYYTSQIPSYKDRAKNFLFVGRISAAQKGADILLDQWLTIFDKIKDWKLQLVGPCSDDFKQIWQSKIKDAKAESSVQWFPAASPNELLNYYKNARVVVCSSRDDSGPIVLSEAIVSGCAFIGTAVGEIPDILNDMNGLVKDVNKLGDELLLFALNDNIALEQAIRLRGKLGNRKWSEQVKKIKHKKD